MLDLVSNVAQQLFETSMCSWIITCEHVHIRVTGLIHLHAVATAQDLLICLAAYPLFISFAGFIICLFDIRGAVVHG